jgi:hypothetical protein
MTARFPTLSLQATAAGQIAVAIEHVSPQGESMAFRVFIESAPPQRPARTVQELALAGCDVAQQLLDALRRAYGDAVESPTPPAA